MPRIDSKKFYTSAIKTHGITAKGVRWSSKESQELRFKILLDLLPQKIDSLVDAGCGFGDFYHYLKKQDVNVDNYIGIDFLQEMCDITHKNTGQKIVCADITKDSLPLADYYLCSGAMNILEQFETHLFIRNCFSSAKKGFVFNVLHGTKKSASYNYVTTNKIKIIAKSLGIKKVLMKTDYLQDDITVGFFHV